MLKGGKGVIRGQFDFPRGIAVDPFGNIVVADTNNGRIQRFSATGTFLSMFGELGWRHGQFREPNGVAIDSKGNVYVADVSNQRVQKLDLNGRFLTEWKGPSPGFYGPRDIWISDDDFVYVVDQGRSRIVRLDSNGTDIAVWGSQGREDGQFDEPTAVVTDTKSDRVYVADPHNRRIEVFDSKGTFITKWPVPEWQPTGWSFQDMAIDPEGQRLYLTSPATDEVLVYDLVGNKINALKPEPPKTLEGASGLVLTNRKLYVLCAFSNRVQIIDLQGK